MLNFHAFERRLNAQSTLDHSNLYNLIKFKFSWSSNMSYKFVDKIYMTH